MKKIFSILIVILISLLALEALLGYYYYQKRQLTKYTALGTTWNWIMRRLHSNTNIPYQVQIVIQPYEADPFLEYDKSIGYKFHPTIDYTGVHGRFPDRIRLDYFGFRNDTNLYFDEKRDYTLIVMTGGDEAAGSCHRTTIAQNLERILNKEGGQRYKVLNLAMNSYTVPNEMSAYVHLAYQLKPEFVISHSGWNDLMEGLQVPYNFKRLGLNYMKSLEHWLPRLYELKNNDAKHLHVVKMNSSKENNLIVENYLKNLKKYRDVVTVNGGKFIIGIQKYRKIPLPAYDELYRLLPEMIKIVHGKNGFKEGIIDFTQREDIAMTPGDPVCSNDEGSRLIAKIYAEQILHKKILAKVQ